MYIEQITDEVYAYGTKRQKEYVDAVRKAGDLVGAAKALEVSPPTVSKSLKALLARAARKGAIKGMPEMIIAQGKVLGKMTTQVDGAGEIKNVWYRQDKDTERQLELIKTLTLDILEEVKPLAPAKLIARNHKEDLMVIIPIGDAHIGMLAWGEESGADYDLTIAESIHKGAVDMLIEQTPAASYCTILDLGDFIHSDNMDGMTSRSGHALDMDGRYHKVVRVAIRIALYYIDQALKKFEHVTYRAEMGNHNDVGSIWLQELLAVLYRNEPRVTIGNGAGVTFFWNHGDCAFMTHHGHLIRGERLYQLFAKKLLDDNNRSVHRKIYCGHVHHKSVTENAICEIETYRTLAAKDAYASGHGYHAGRSITAEVWHKKFGELSKINVTIPMLENNE